MKFRKNIILPSHPSLIKANDADVIAMRKSLIRNALNNYKVTPTEADIEFFGRNKFQRGIRKRNNCIFVEY